MSGAIAIFAKTPGLTPAKTRLAVAIGAARAEEFHRLSLDAVAQSVSGFLQDHPDWIARWAVAEEQGVDDPRWRPFGARHTGPGALGERMWRVYEAMRRVHGRVFLIGADAPQISAPLLKAAVKALDSGDYVFGPARDGGFWLFGGRRMIPKEIWLSPRYSSADARTDFESGLKQMGLKPGPLLPVLTDIDEADDLARLAAEWPSPMTPPQRRLARWLGVPA